MARSTAFRTSRILPGHAVGAELAGGVRRDAANVLAELAVEEVDVEGHEHRHVFEVIPERRQHDWEDIEPVEEILAEMAGVDLFLEVPVRGCDNPDVDRDVVRAADTLERLFLEEAEELGLERRYHLADFVEEDRAAVGLLEQPALLLARVGERAALVAEQLALEQASRGWPSR